MSPTLEFEDKNVEMAVKKACKELNIPREKLKHDVISYGSTGIFGLVGTKKARIRVTIPKSPQESKPGASDTGKPKKASFKSIPDDTDSKKDASMKDSSGLYSVDDAKNTGKDALQFIIDFITEGAAISIKEEPNRIFFNINGGNSAVLIGKRGQTLDAIQYLVDKIVNGKRKDRIAVQVDVEDYLEKRRVSLEKTAERLAEKVKKTGKPAALGQMNSHDRRIVHIALKNDNKVRTQSMGEGVVRKLVIFPKKNSSRKKNGI